MSAKDNMIFSGGEGILTAVCCEDACGAFGNFHVNADDVGLTRIGDSDLSAVYGDVAGCDDCLRVEYVEEP